MVDDPPPPSNSNRGGNGSRKGGVNPILLLFLPTLLKWLFKRPKFLLVLLALGAGWYFFGGSFSGNEVTDSSDENALATGLNMDAEVYAQSEIFEPLAVSSKNGRPSRVSLEKYCPKRGNQGSQGSCVGWSSSYAARTIMHSRATGQNGNVVAFSPASLYNQISLPNCQGAYIHNAMDVMKQRGVLPWNDFGYNENDCDTKPSRAQLNKASQYKTRGFQRLWETQGESDIEAIKQNIAQGAPVVIGIMVGGSFMTAMRGQKLWEPTRRDYNQGGFGGHAMCVMGYDDNYAGGALQIMNSWGEDWGDRGFCWIRYKDFEHFNKEAYGLYPMGNAEKQDPTKLAVEFGLVFNENGQNMNMQQVSGNLFRNVNKIAKGTRFKVEVTNSIECFTYVFGQELNGSSYVLFPYTSKHSPYCGITGTRLFPRGQSLMADADGNRDHMVVVVSKVELNWNELNSAINAAPGTYQQKVNTALSSVQISNPQFTSGNTIRFNANITDKKAVAMVFEIDKMP
ncbi:MAG: C1A family cysteine protease [Bacteroidia bacterium]|jgi:C1A family cysteine protease